MNKIYYSQSKDAFYPEALKEAYLAKNTFPEDCFEVLEEDFIEFSSPPTGKVRSYKDDKFSWIDVEISDQDISMLEKFWRDSELVRADSELNKVQDADPKATGSVADWRTFRKNLRSWPESSEFPNKDFRPVAPDA